MPGLYVGNQHARPTGRMILYHFSGLRLADYRHQPRRPAPSP